MFSYRHAFHAGNHADVLKHTTLLAILRHLTQKDTALTFIDTHAGAGLYRLDGDYAHTSGEAAQGYLQWRSQTPNAEPLAPALQDYLELIDSFNAAGSHRVYPGSPFIMQRVMRPQDRMHLFELHPTDAKTLRGHVEQLQAGRQIAVRQEDGFTGLKKLLPPPSRRAFVLCDPSYEMKSDYQSVQDMLEDALKRFATGTTMVWYPIIPRPEAHDLPRKLKAMAQRAGRSWLHATLTVKTSKLTTDEHGEVVRPGLPASGVFVINPPHTLKAALEPALGQMAQRLAQGKSATHTLESGH